MFWTGFLSIIRSLVLYSQQWNNLIQLASSQQNLYDIHLLLCIQYLTPDDGQKICPKYVEFQSKNKFEKLMHLVGFIIRIYHYAQSSECQMLNIKQYCYPTSHCSHLLLYSYISLLSSTYLGFEICTLGNFKITEYCFVIQNICILNI